MNALLSKLGLFWRSWRAQHPQIKAYYSELAQLLPCKVIDVPLMAVDLEMTGLDANFDQILSIGLVPIVRGQLQLANAQHQLVSIDGSVGQSAAIHGILDSQLDGALSPEKAMAWFLEQSRGHLLVAHHAPLDIAFLQQGILGLLKEPINLLAIDTMAIEKRRLLRQHEVLKEGELRLGACRSRYNLPVYTAHNALIDAIACGELLTAQIAAMGEAHKITVAELF
ncbi:exonuclease domain-containing protein [Shewanella waksmanii]|uniref:exonuclease domain-containing protein n=1 Tax=Shewanella waksmanii TaxID=213783 RepID=UPI003736753F